MASDNLKKIMGDTMENVRSMINTDSIVGTPIPINGGATTIIPISQVSYGFASGGSDIPSKSSKDLFGGGGGSGSTTKPVAFIVVTGDDVKLIPMPSSDNPTNQAFNMIPEILDKVAGMVSKNKKDKKAPEAEA